MDESRANLARLIAFIFRFQGDPERLIMETFNGNEQMATDEAIRQVEFVYGKLQTYTAG